MSPDLAASVHQRLLNLARSESRNFNELLQHYALERFLYRLGLSPHADRFVLKGALMLKAWEGQPSRATRDIDLLGQLDNSVEAITLTIKAICDQPVPVQDGLIFHADSVQSGRITEAAQYTGVRSQFLGTLGRSRVPMRVDIGFGDIVVPDPVTIHFPTLLSFPAPVIRGYSKESVIAEKLQAMVFLGMINSRMKDFYDLWTLAGRFDFDGKPLAAAIQETFQRRQTPLQLPIPALSPEFARQPETQAQWRAFVRRQRLSQEAPTLETVLEVLQTFVIPIVGAHRTGEAFDRYWLPGGPWQDSPPK